MSRKITHEKYHSKIKLQKRIIATNNFTYRKTVYFVDKFFKNKENILDIGSGAGTVDFYLANRGHSVVGIDISNKAVRTATVNANLFSLQKKIRFLVSDFPYGNVAGKYDGVLISEVLEHLKDDNLAIKRIRRLLNKNSIVIASSPSINAPLYRLGFLKKFDLKVGHLRRYDEGQFINLFESNGFKVLEITRTEGVLRNLLFTNDVFGLLVKYIRGPISDLVTFLDDLTIDIFGESNFYIVAKKV